MTRSACWSFSALGPDTKVFIVTDPRLITKLLIPFIGPGLDGSYGPYVDAALTTADADESPGIYRGTTSDFSRKAEQPFAHETVTARIDLASKHTLTGPFFADATQVLEAHYRSAPWQKPKPSKRGQDALESLLDGVLDGKGAEFLALLDGDESTSQADAFSLPNFLGVVLPENETSQHLLTTVLSLAVRNAWHEAHLEVQAGRGRL